MHSFEPQSSSRFDPRRLNITAKQLLQFVTLAILHNHSYVRMLLNSIVINLIFIQYSKGITLEIDHQYKINTKKNQYDNKKLLSPS